MLEKQMECLVNPFELHRDKILGHYSAAGFLRKVVLSLWNGTAHPTGLSGLTNLDAPHYRAFREMVDQYHTHGENDQVFMRLAEECNARYEEEEAARQRAERHESWARQVQWALKKLNLEEGVVDDHYNWFEHRFDLNDSPEAAAHAWKVRAAERV